VSKYPDMSKVKPSKRQKENRNRMKEAVAYARSILHDVKKKTAYQKKIGRGKNVYREAIKEFLTVKKQ
jgi:hypothetical protein